MRNVLTSQEPISCIPVENIVHRLEQRQICLLDKKPVMAKPVLRILIVDITTQDKWLVQIYIYCIVK